MCQTHQFRQGRGESIGRPKQLDMDAYDMFCDDGATLPVSLDTLHVDNPHLDRSKAYLFLPLALIYALQKIPASTRVS